MKAIFALFLLLAIVAGCTVASGQQFQVDRTNRSIAVTVTEKASTDAEIAVVTIGYFNYGPTQDQAYEENVRASGKIVAAILKAGVAKEDIHTESLNLERVDQSETKWTAEEKRERQFSAHQAWEIRIRADRAQLLVDTAVEAGANEVRDVDWHVADQGALEAKANSAALEKARTLADSMARGMGAKLGQLLYASNRVPGPSWMSGATLNTMAAAISRAPGLPEKPVLKLFPKKVTAEATVYAVFGLE